MSAAAASATTPDAKLEKAFEKFFRPMTAGKSTRLAAEIRTDQCMWDLFVGQQYCKRTSACVLQIVVNNVRVEEGNRHKGIFKQGMKLLQERFAPKIGAPVVVLDCIRNGLVYEWSLKQPRCYVSAYHPESVCLYTDDFVEDESRPNMANTVITVDKIREASKPCEEESGVTSICGITLHQWCKEIATALAIRNFKAQQTS
jgi:hypothetical protein